MQDVVVRDKGKVPMSDVVVHLRGDREDVKPLRPGAGKDVSVDA